MQWKLKANSIASQIEVSTLMLGISGQEHDLSSGRGSMYKRMDAHANLTAVHKL